jgi:dolichol-phosphate mannosyltransferase
MKRKEGKSQWTFSKKMKWFIDAVISYSYLPIRFMSSFGVVVALIGFFFALYVLYQRLFTENYVYGLSPIIMLILILSGFQLVMSGVIGEYVLRTLSQTRNRVKYVIDEVVEEK